MKKLFTAAAVCLVASALAACGSNPTVPKLTPVQVASIVCPAAKTELNTLSLAGVFTGGAQDTLSKQVQPDIDAVCVAGASITDTKLQTLSDTAFPLVITIVKNSSLSDEDKNKAYLAIGGFQALINVNIALVAASAASAPAAASAPVSQ